MLTVGPHVNSMLIAPFCRVLSLIMFFMQRPPGFVNPKYLDHVCHLKKAIYGLCQAPQAWYNELRSFLISIGFLKSYSNTSLFIQRYGGHVIYLVVYVDDIIVTGTSEPHVSEFITSLVDLFSQRSQAFSIFSLCGNSTYLLRTLFVPTEIYSWPTYKKRICWMPM